MRLTTLTALLLASGAALATDISVVGVFPNKAVLVVDGGGPKTYSVGATIAEGVKLVAADSDGATIEINGKRRTIAMGEHVNRSTSDGGRQSVTLQADGQGHYVVNGQINGGSVRMLLDTGATLIALPASEATRLGIDYKKGTPGYVNTANGVAPTYRVKLNTVKVGDVEINQVDAFVQEQGLPIILLGMSFLNRTEMRRDGAQMVLTKRF
ncbi:retropepsin-like aspartic protease family protein [Noviherbaspirillum denitrificans]|uniref:Aspartyl protease n=1 Tax=Noviherbaspirillum denitrificans TaxID=1968433 RepID=A0A254TAN3_9BURK|nr:TIGR02281 family clan AA aspartic protease [Noviherbaspirillum denitrificans]OWW19710.1 aspartyl protease [Noviherbaspirillum denitrificans]